MWTKIHNDEQSKKLQIGTIIIEYPVSGLPADTIDFNDMNNLNSYQVILVNPMTGEIDLAIPVMETEDKKLLNDSVGFHNHSMDDSPIVHKFFEDLKEEKVWWVEENGNQ